MFKENYKKYLAELIGTCALVAIGCGAAVLAGTVAGLLAVVLAFGLTVTFMAYSVGQISGGHFNPAVTLAAWINKRIDGKNACFYVLSQIIGGLLGGLILFLIIKLAGGAPEGNMAANYRATVGPDGNAVILTLFIELLATAIFTFVIMGITSNKENGRIAGLVIGLTLAIMLLITGPFTNGSLNPARSLGVAFFDTTDLKDIWMFIVAPLAGGALGGIGAKFLFKKEEQLQ